jgi:DNA (cytosine-5)-methyltransferase 1
VLENVAALLNRGLDRVLGTLAEVGYDAEWHCIPASSVGAPHRRDRVWIVAHSSGERRREAGRDRPDEPAKWFAWCGEDVADTAGIRLQGERASGEQVGYARSPKRQLERVCRTRGAVHWAIEPAMGRVAYGIPRRVDRLRCLGNAIVPQVAEVVARMTKDILDGE